MPEPKLTSYLDVDFAKLRDTQGTGPFENIPGADCRGRGTLLVIDMVPGAPWPHPCLWLGMRNWSDDLDSSFGMRPWTWPPKLPNEEPEEGLDPEDEADQELYDYLDTLDPDTEVPLPVRADWDKSKPRPEREPALDECPPLGTKCSLCGEPQYDTPGGSSCKNGHGGADPA